MRQRKNPARTGSFLVSLVFTRMEWFSLLSIIAEIVLFVVDAIFRVVLKKGSEDVYKALKERFSKTKERDEG